MFLYRNSCKSHGIMIIFVIMDSQNMWWCWSIVCILTWCIRNYLCVFWAGYFLCSLNFNQKIDRNGNKRVHRQHIFTDAITNIQTGEWIVVRRYYTQCCCPVMHPPTTSSGLPYEQWKQPLTWQTGDWYRKSEVTTITELHTMDILATISFFKIDTADW